MDIDDAYMQEAFPATDEYYNPGYPEENNFRDNFVELVNTLMYRFQNLFLALMILHQLMKE